MCTIDYTLHKLQDWVYTPLMNSFGVDYPEIPSQNIY